jgi:DNA polymerase III epsilon subunit-like protein
MREERTMSEKFDMQCVVELFGHSRIAGKATEQAIGGATFLRIDVPKTSKREGFTRFYGAGAIYSITPVDEQVAAAMAESLEVEPVSEWTLRQAMQKLLAAPAPDREDWDSSMEWPDETATPKPAWEEDEPDEAEDPMLAFDTGPDPDEDVRADPEEETAAKAFYRRADDKRAAADWARALLQGEFVIVDTETTGFEETDEIVQIGIVDQTGAVVLDQLIHPEQPILNSQYHGITDETVKDAPRFPEAYERIKAALGDGTVGSTIILAYNFAYDRRMLDQVCQRHGLEPFDFSQIVLRNLGQPCVMEMYAQFNGEWNAHHGNYRWKKLREAMAYFGLAFEGKEHNAVSDAKATLAVIRTMAQYGTMPVSAETDASRDASGHEQVVTVEGPEG